MVESPDGDASPGVNAVKTPLEADIEAFLEEQDAGNTRKHYRSVLVGGENNWADWLGRRQRIRAVEDVDVDACAAYARYLAKRTRGGGISGGTARTYYDYVSAFLHWCVEGEKLDTNPARVRRAVRALPEDRGDTETQFWAPEDREQLLQHVDERAHEALDAEGDGRAGVFRDRAIASILALSGARGAEVFRDPDDEHRNGLRWRDVDLDNSSAAVLGKSRQTENVPLPGRVVAALEQHRRTQQPPSEEWPVFPTRHRPTLARLEEGEVPPSITVGGARDVMKRISEAAGLDISGEYLKPHGGRRGIGGVLYRENAAFAQKLLRHQSLETTNKTYEDIQAGEVAGKVDEVLGVRHSTNKDRPDEAE